MKVCMLLAVLAAQRCLYRIMGVLHKDAYITHTHRVHFAQSTTIKLVSFVLC